jgi:VIT1/CCC1 family predicted Fe2+/Mn2+ transporter
MIRTPESAVETYARAQLGLDPNDLGSPWAAALSSLLTFAGGALVPLLPWFFFSGPRALYASVGLAAAAALLVGGILGQLAERRWLRWALRQLGIVAFAASATWLVGHLFGTPVS